jgi:hypothetical protein
MLLENTNIETRTFDRLKVIVETIPKDAYGKQLIANNEQYIRPHFRTGCD